MSLLPNELLFVVGGNLITAAFEFLAAFFVLFQNWRRPSNLAFFAQTMAIGLFTFFFAMSALQTDHAIAYTWWRTNIIDVFIAMTSVQLVFTLIGKTREWRWFLILSYVIGGSIFVASLFYPHLFLPDVTPKLYFPYYLNAGWLYIAMVAYLFVFVFIAFMNLLVAFWSSSGVVRQRYEYFIFAFILGYSLGGWNFLLVFNIPGDPIFGMFLWVHLIPIAYGIFSSDLLDIRIVARRGLFYAGGIAIITAFLASLILLNNVLTETFPHLQFWTVPAIVGIIAAFIGRFVWAQVTEAEKLKYEFITVATHKLRTPLTQIRWSLAELMPRAEGDPALLEGLRRIDESNNRLIELTTDLMEAAHSGEGTNGYKKEAVDLTKLADDTLEHFKLQVTTKKIIVTKNFETAVPVQGDKRHTESVVNVFIENAITYTPAGGTIHIEAKKEGNKVRFSVKDSGIGVAVEDRDRLFKSFFRTDKAKTADTEGVGLGLSLAKSTIERQGGSIGFTSEGEGKGSTFWFVLPEAPKSLLAPESADAPTAPEK